MGAFNAGALERLATQSIESLGMCLSDFGIMELLLYKGPRPVNEIGRRIASESPHRPADRAGKRAAPDAGGNHVPPWSRHDYGLFVAVTEVTLV